MYLKIMGPNVREQFRKGLRKVEGILVPSAPSPEGIDYLNNVMKGDIPELPTNSLPNGIIFDYYGEFRKNPGTQNARIRIPLSGRELEVSFNVSRASGSFRVVREGILVVRSKFY